MNDVKRLCVPAFSFIIFHPFHERCEARERQGDLQSPLFVIVDLEVETQGWMVTTFQLLLDNISVGPCCIGSLLARSTLGDDIMVTQDLHRGQIPHQDTVDALRQNHLMDPVEFLAIVLDLFPYTNDQATVEIHLAEPGRVCHSDPIASDTHGLYRGIEAEPVIETPLDVLDRGA